MINFIYICLNLCCCFLELRSKTVLSRSKMGHYRPKGPYALKMCPFFIQMWIIVLNSTYIKLSLCVFKTWLYWYFSMFFVCENPTAIWSITLLFNIPIAQVCRDFTCVKLLYQCLKPLFWPSKMLWKKCCHFPCLIMQIHWLHWILCTKTCKTCGSKTYLV